MHYLLMKCGTMVAGPVLFTADLTKAKDVARDYIAKEVDDYHRYVVFAMPADEAVTISPVKVEMYPWQFTEHLYRSGGALSELREVWRIERNDPPDFSTNLFAAPTYKEIPVA